MGKCEKMWLAACLGLTLMLTSCAAPLAAPETPTPLESPSQAAAAPAQTDRESSDPSPAQTPEANPAPDPQEILQAMAQVDILSYISPELYARSEGEKWYEPVIGQTEETLALPTAYLHWVEAAISTAHDFGVSSVALQVDTPSWPVLAAIVANYYGDPDNMRTALLKAGGLRCEVAQTSSGGYEATVFVEPPDAPTLMYELPETEATNPYSLLAAYAYLSTIYDDNMHYSDGPDTPELEELLFPIVQPDRYYVGDCWAQPRDGGARLHTGIDINAPEGTDLLAVVDGVILDNGYNSVAGNFVVLRGNDGYQYHYYHLVELSDLEPGTPVRRGDVVAHVGSTGNSRANHLHFTIITPEGNYINPFPYMLKSQERTIAASEDR